MFFLLKTVRCTPQNTLRCSRFVGSYVFVPLTCEVVVGSVSGASASSGELEREIKDGSARGPSVGVPGAAGEPCGMATVRRGLEERRI